VEGDKAKRNAGEGGGIRRHRRTGNSTRGFLKKKGVRGVFFSARSWLLHVERFGEGTRLKRPSDRSGDFAPPSPLPRPRFESPPLFPVFFLSSLWAFRACRPCSEGALAENPDPHPAVRNRPLAVGVSGSCYRSSAAYLGPRQSMGGSRRARLERWTEGASTG